MQRKKAKVLLLAAAAAGAAAGAPRRTADGDSVRSGGASRTAAAAGAVAPVAAPIPPKPARPPPAPLPPGKPAAALRVERGGTLARQAAAHVAGLPSSRVKAMLASALAEVGTPYRWGGDDPTVDGGYDCVGLPYHLFHASGMEFPLPRFSSLNMTDAPRGDAVPSVWWTEYVPDFAGAMQRCAAPFADGDVLVFHELTAGRISDRTGHAVIVVDAAAGLAVSAATGGVRVHALGDLRRYGPKQLTGCWRAASASAAPYRRPALTWTVGLSGGKGTHASPYTASNPLTVDVGVAGEGIGTATLTVAGRVLSLIGAVAPLAEELPPTAAPLAAAGQVRRRWRLRHDFKAVDLPVDPGEHIPTPQRKIVLRLIDELGLVLGEKAFYVAFRPYW